MLDVATPHVVAPVLGSTPTVGVVGLLLASAAPVRWYAFSRERSHGQK